MIDDDPISKSQVEKRWPALQAVSSSLLQCLGPKFTDTAEGHIQTDIAATGSLAGLMVLQETVADLPNLVAKSGPGNVVLSEVHAGQELVHRFMFNVAIGSGIDPRGGWFDPVPDVHDPMLKCEEMTRRLGSPFYASCNDATLDRDYYKFAAALAAVRLIRAGLNLKLLEPGPAKGLAFYYVVAGSKTVPYPEALWPN